MVRWSKYCQHPHCWYVSQHSPWQLWHLWNSETLYVHAWSAKPLKVTLFVLITVCMISHYSVHLTTNQCPVDTTPIPVWSVHILGAWRVLLWTTLPQHLLLPPNPICCQSNWGYTHTRGSWEGMMMSKHKPFLFLSLSSLLQRKTLSSYSIQTNVTLQNFNSYSNYSVRVSLYMLHANSPNIHENCILYGIMCSS